MKTVLLFCAWSFLLNPAFANSQKSNDYKGLNFTTVKSTFSANQSGLLWLITESFHIKLAFAADNNNNEELSAWQNFLQKVEEYAEQLFETARGFMSWFLGFLVAEEEERQEMVTDLQERISQIEEELTAKERDQQMIQCKLDLEKARIERNRLMLTEAGVSANNIECYEHSCQQTGEGNAAVTTCNQNRQLNPGTLKRLRVFVMIKQLLPHLLVKEA